MAEACDVERAVMLKYAPSTGGPKIKDISKILLDNWLSFNEKLLMGTNYPAHNILWPTCFNVNLIRDVPLWKIPVYIMQADNDHFTETSLAKEYFNSLKAPEKKWFLFENATHSVEYEYPEKYRSIYINYILK